MLQKTEKRNQGFSLVELLVVILIISVLAAIAVPAFMNQRYRAWQAQSEAALKNAATSMEALATKAPTPGDYTGIDEARLRIEGGLKYNADLTLEVEAASEGGYCLSADHSLSGQVLYYDSANGVPENPDCSSEY